MHGVLHHSLSCIFSEACLAVNPSFSDGTYVILAASGFYSTIHLEVGSQVIGWDSNKSRTHTKHTATRISMHAVQMSLIHNSAQRIQLCHQLHRLLGCRPILCMSSIEGVCVCVCPTITLGLS